MSKRENYETKTEQLLIPIAGKYGVEIYDVEYVKEGGEWYLRAYIDKPEGVAILDCENVSRELSDALDAEDFIPDAYILEVSSPGLGRTLKKDRHLEKSLGAEVEIRTYKPVDGRKEFTGVLHAYDGDTITIEEPRPDTGETDADKAAEPGTERVLNRKEIALIRLTFDF
ncbi:MAG: ribosome maturation factor RimP [Lachnospiraceae bacterium]|nr:ribosome maturation factor RimP [Lachnospiraceae bacterium]